MTLERTVLEECWGMESREQGAVKGVLRMCESQNGALELKDL